MKILKLELRSIGPFTDQTLSFESGQHGLHIVYGPNEGGKSSCLRAMTQWLFGMETLTKTRDAFVHVFNDLRVGGTIRGDDGTELTCVRRPGGRTSLREANDRTRIEPDVLVDLLGGLSRDEFSTKFGIDLDALVSGGKAITTSQGEVGEALFAAGSGLASVVAVQKKLEAEGDLLFKFSTARTPMVNAALHDWKTARGDVGDHATLSTDWNRRQRDLAEQRSEKERLEREWIQRQSKRDRMRRIHDALPAIGGLRDLRAELKSMNQVPRLRPDFTADRVQTTTALASAVRARSDATAELERLRKTAAEIGELPVVLERASAVEALFGQVQLYWQWQRERPQFRDEQKRLEASARATLKTLRPDSDLDLDQAGGLRIAVGVRSTIDQLAQQRSGLVTALSASQRELKRREAELAEASDELASMNDPVDADTLKRSIAVAQRLGDIDGQIEQKACDLAQLRSDADIALHRLPSHGMPADQKTLESLESLSVPTPEALSRFSNDLDQAESRIERVNEEIRKLGDERATAQEELRTIQSAVDVPTEDELDQARRQRDQQWAELEKYLLDLSSADNSISGADASVAAMAGAFAASVEHCDDLADRLRREATKVSDKARLIAVSLRCDESIAERRRQLDSLEADFAKLDASYRAAWAASGIDPATPTEMKSWLGQHAALVDASETIRKREVSIERDVKQRSEQRRVLVECLAASGEVAESGDTLSPILDVCQQRLESITNQNAALASLQTSVQNLTRERDLAKSGHDEAEQNDRAWRAQWDAAMATIDNDAGLEPTEARAVLDAIDTLIDDIDQAEEAAGQWRLVNDQINAFDARVADLTDSLKFDVGDSSPDRVVADLHDRLKAARDQRASLDHLQEQIEAEEKRLLTASADIASLEDKLMHLCGEAGCQSADDLSDAEAASAKRRQIEQAVAEKESEIRVLAQADELESFIQQAIDEDADTLLPRAEQLDAEIKQTKSELETLSDRIAIEQSELDKINGSDQAAEANERAEEAVARAVTHAEQFVRVKLGSAMLKRAITRYRSENQDPILRRAGELFSRITLGSFSGLEIDTSDDARHVLVGVRMGKFVHVEQMSEGTCDQLFLSLRLASLERYLETHSPVPFIVDDILTNFDDKRSAATLEVLGELSTRTQVILFTHHRHLIDVATAAVPDDRLFVQSLDDSIRLDSAPVAKVAKKTATGKKKAAKRSAPSKQSPPNLF